MASSSPGSDISPDYIRHIFSSKSSDEEHLKRLVPILKDIDAYLTNEEVDDDTVGLLLHIFAQACGSKLQSSRNDVLTLLLFLSTSSILDKRGAELLLRKPDGEHSFQCILTDLATLLQTLNMITPASILTAQKIGLITLLQKQICENEQMNDEIEIKDAIQDLQNNLLVRLAEKSEARKKDKNQRELKEDKWKPPEDFRKLSVMPEESDLLYATVFLRRNKRVGRYNDLDHYLDVQFRLYREDCIVPLREAYEEFLTKDKEHRNFRLESGRLYRDIQILKGTSTSAEHGEVFIVEISKEHRKRIRWNNSRRLTFGSLLIMSFDRFKTKIFAVVSDSDPERLRNEGLFKVKIYRTFNNQQIPRENKGIIIEATSAYFESYVHVLKALQSINDYLPFQRYIVECNEEISLPRYLAKQPEALYSIELNRIIRIPVHQHRRYGNFARDEFKERKVVSKVEVVDINKWPSSKDLGMDESQRQAFISALTREFVLIQGPPGTGKTYLGLQIAKCLLMNTEIWRETPIFNPELGKKPCLLVVCYTNHALDQFIEGIINFLPQKDKIERREIPEVIRIGSRCKNETVEKFSIKNFRYIISRDRENQETIIGKAEAAKKHVLRIRAVLKAIQSKKVVVHFWNMKPYMLNFHVEQFTRDSSNIWYDWLQASPGKWCEECQKPKQLKKRTTRETRREENEKQGEIDKMFESEVNERTLDDDTEYQLDMNIVGIDLELQLKQMLDTIPDETYQERLRNEAQITFDFLQDGEVVSEDKMQSQAKLGKRNMKERWGMYHYWLNRFVEALKQTLHEKEEEYNKIFEEYRTARLEIDEEILKRTSVIAITTTGAAKYHDSLMKIGPQITIIEEAAEVPESHIVTAINPDCEHLILIGDHKQLEPKPAVIELATRFNLSISLFERMLNNGLHYNCLQRQHRMRPEISNLVRHMYPVLEDNENVLEYDNVNGVGHNLFFITHEYPEEFNEDNRSYSSEHEAEYIKELCRYILKQGQMLLLRSKMPRGEFDGVNISVLDNYQGEENEIIILSLVRSNTRGDIGFLRRENRICVALSRAKKGLYILGNSSTLIQQSEEWKIVIDKIQTTKSNGEEVCLLGKALPLYCQNHPQTKILAESSHDFAKAPDGGCELKCQLRLDCGHSCRLFCHPYDQEHKEYACRSTCNKRCPEEHVCAKTCHFRKDCKCSVMMNRDLPCGHSAYLQCHVNTLDYKCLIKVERELDCGHIVSLSCHDDYEDYDCEVIVSDIRDDCGHSFERECHDEHYGRRHKCNVVVEKEFPLCKHTKHLKCYEPIQYHKCEKPISKKLDCGHTHIKSCHEWRFGSHTCREKCENVCPNDHICQKPCHHPLPCDCQVKMVKKIPKCGHFVKMACSESVVNYKDCDQRVDIVLKICGHTVEGRCREKFQIEESGKSTKPELEIAMKCQQKAKVQLPKCKHILAVKCWEKMNMLQYWEQILLSGNVSVPHQLEKTCTGSVTVELRCGHKATTECCKKDEYETKSDEDCLLGKANVKCNKQVSLKQFCEHNIEVECWKKHRYEKEVNSSTRLSVLSPLRKYVRLRHIRLVEELDIRCKSLEDVQLHCGHMKSVRCWEKYMYEARPETSFEYFSGMSFDLTKQIPQLKCETKVKIELPVCGHVIAVKCCEKDRFKPSEVKCSELVTYVYDHCGHSIQVQCYEHPRHASRLSSTRQKHSMPPCQAEITKELECGHDVTCKCSESKFIKCPNDCSKRMGCGHACIGKCEVCFTHLTHKECNNICDKSLFCGHKCKSKKCMKCVRCDMKCMFRCAHAKCRQKCNEPCIACPLPCNWECEHYKCTEICSRSCNRPRCNDNCKNILSCGHVCSGFCSEPCPRACLKCDYQSFSNVDENDSKTVTITDCGHSFGYQYLDLYMEAKASNIIARCPTCQNVFYWHPRYDTILKTKKVFTEEIKHILAEKFKGLRHNYFPICDADVFRHFNAYIEKFLAFLQLNRYIVTDAGDMGAVNNFQVFGIRLMNVMQKTNTNSFQNFQNISDELFNVYVMWIEVLLGRNENLSNINLKIKHKAPINNSTASSALALHADVQNVNENNDQTLFSIEIDALSGQEVVSKLKEYRQKCKKDRLMRLLSELKRFIIDDPHAADAMKYPVLSNVHVVGIHEADWFICSKGHVVPAVVSDDCFICKEGDDVKAWIQKFEPNFQSNEHFKKVETETPKGRKRGKKNRKSNNETERETGSQLLFPGVGNGTDTDTTKREHQQQPINFLDSILNPQQAPTRNFNPHAHRGRYRGGQHISTSRDRRTQHEQTSSSSSGGFQLRDVLGRDSPSVGRNDRESNERGGMEQRRGRGRGERGRGGNERGGRGRGRGEYNERGGRGSSRGERGGRGRGGGEFSDRGGRGRGGGEFSDRGSRGRSGRGERGGRGRTGRGGGRNRR